MAGAKTPWMRRVFQMLEDGPHPFETLLAETGGLIPPGMAWREREVGRRWGATRTVNPVLSHKPDPEVTDEKLWSGRRRVLKHYLWSACRDGRIVKYDEDGREMYALGHPRRLGCPPNA